MNKAIASVIAAASAACLGIFLGGCSPAPEGSQAQPSDVQQAEAYTVTDGTPTRCAGKCSLTVPEGWLYFEDEQVFYEKDPWLDDREYDETGVDEGVTGYLDSDKGHLLDEDEAPDAHIVEEETGDVPVYAEPAEPISAEEYVSMTSRPYKYVKLSFLPAGSSPASLADTEATDVGETHGQLGLGTDARVLRSSLATANATWETTTEEAAGQIVCESLFAAAPDGECLRIEVRGGSDKDAWVHDMIESVEFSN